MNSHLANVSLLPQTRTHRAFVAICRHAQGGRECACPVCMSSQEIKQETLPSCLSSHVVTRCAFHSTNAMFLFWWFFCIVVLCVGHFCLKCSSRTVLKYCRCFTRVRCFMEKICVLGKRPSGVSRSVMGVSSVSVNQQ